MCRVRRSSFFSELFAIVVLSLAAAGCSTQAKGAPGIDPAGAVEPLEIAATQVVPVPVDRFLRVTGSLIADEQAEVSAETAGRVVATPVERGTPVAAGAVLVRVAASEAGAQLEEAEANAAQIEARLGLNAGDTFDPARVPDVMNAKAGLDLAEAEFERIESLLHQQVVSQSEFDQRRTQVEAAHQQYQAAVNAAQQSYRSLDAARARVDLARKAMADTLVRAPFSGVVAERLVSVGDYVSRGTRVATVVRIDPLRVELTIPEQYIALIERGQQVRLAVDPYPGETFDATIRFVSPSLRSDQRAMTVEAVAKNADGRLKPGLFVTASIRQSESTPGLLVPARAIETISGTSRVFVVKDGRAEERIVTVGEATGDRVELTSGVAAGEVVAAAPRGRITDGRAVRVR